MTATVKTLKTSQDAVAGVQVGSKHASMTVRTGNGETNGIYVDDTGVYIRGKMSIMTMPDQIRMGAFWRQNTAIMQMLPSTTAFPIPNYVADPPLQGLADMARAVAWAMAFLY